MENRIEIRAYRLTYSDTVKLTLFFQELRLGDIFIEFLWLVNQVWGNLLPHNFSSQVQFSMKILFIVLI